MDLSDAVVVNSSRLKSVVWNDFDRVKKGDTYVAICKHCNKRLSGSSTSGTSHLRNHLIRCKRILNHGIEQYSSPREKKNEGPLPLATIKVDTEQKIDEQLSTVNCKYQGRVKEVAVNFASGNLDHKKSQFDLARMTIMHGYPLDMVDHVGFKHFIKNLQPFYELLSPTSVEADCIEIYANEKQKMYEMLDKLPGRISLSIDLTALCDAEYLSLTAHYIDEFWQLKQRLLNFVLVDPSQTEDIKSEVIMTCLMDWDIDRKLFSMTYDGYSLHDNIVDRIRHRLSQNRFLFCDGVLFDVRCVINLIKMMVQEIFEGLFDVTRKIQESIQYVKSSEIGQVKFDELSLQAGVESKKCLCLDNPSRWDSSYIMLTAALEYRGVFSLLQDHDPSFLSCPSDIEWERASVVANHLKLFIDITNAITRSKYPTANIYFSEICDIQLRLNEWSKNLDEFSSSLMAKLKSMFEEYWDKCSLSLAVAAMLDPRYKMKLIEYYYQCLYGSASAELIEEVLNNIKVIYNEHSIGSPLASLDQGMACQVSGGASCLPNLADRLMGFDKFVHETSESPGSKSDLDKYLEEPLFPRTGDFDILNWWKVHTPRYPILSMMARNILAIPMANITHELAFSGEERVVDCSWSSVKADTLQALMCTRDWLTEVSLDAI